MLKLRKMMICLLSMCCISGFYACSSDDNHNDTNNHQNIQDPNKEDPNKEDPNKEDPNREDPNKEDPNKEDPNQEEDPNKEDPNKEDPNKEDPNQEEDMCPEDDAKTSPGICGCGVADSPENTALNHKGVPNCLYSNSATGTVTISIPSSYLVSEMADTETFTVVLDAKPTHDVMIPVLTDDPTEAVAAPEMLVFTPENWNVPQSIVVTGVDDDEVDYDVRFNLMMGPMISEDDVYNESLIEPIGMLNMDDEDGINEYILNQTHVTVYEGGMSNSLTLRLGNSITGYSEGVSHGRVKVYPKSSDPSLFTVTPEVLVFENSMYEDSETAISYPHVIEVHAAAPDGIMDSGKKGKITFTVESNEHDEWAGCEIEHHCYKDFTPDDVEVTVLNADKPVEADVTIRIMSANVTSGDGQRYQNEGVRLIQAVKPDIALLQEFRYSYQFDDSLDSLVVRAFGPEYVYYVGEGSLNNGIVSKYPILSAGSWDSNRVDDRTWDWAVIDIPGDRDLFVVSVHLYTKDNEAEMPVLLNKIMNKVNSDNKNYYVMLGGDFNQRYNNIVSSYLGSFFKVGTSNSEFPRDQNGNIKTYATRKGQIDYLLCSPDFCEMEIPTMFAGVGYTHGHVLDSRVYANYGTLDRIPPVQAGDSDALLMQHMPIFRDFKVTTIVNAE